MHSRRVLLNLSRVVRDPFHIQSRLIPTRTFTKLSSLRSFELTKNEIMNKRKSYMLSSFQSQQGKFYLFLQL
jgi:hypothetical protein